MLSRSAQCFSYVLDIPWCRNSACTCSWKGALAKYPAAMSQASKNQVPSKKARDVICTHTYTYLLLLDQCIYYVLTRAHAMWNANNAVTCYYSKYRYYILIMHVHEHVHVHVQVACMYARAHLYITRACRIAAVELSPTVWLYSQCAHCVCGEYAVHVVRL